MEQIRTKQAEIRDAIKAENELINQRLTWLGTFQGLLLDQVKPKQRAGLDVEGTRSRSGWFWWLMPGYFVPGLFVFGWIAIVAIHAYRI
jgi:hypothetical protein